MAVTNVDIAERDLDGDTVTNAARWEIPETEIPTSEAHHNAKALTGGKDRRFVKHANIVNALPEPGTVFRSYELPVEHTEVKILVEMRAIVTVGSAPSAAETSSTVNAYATNPAAWQYIQSYSDDRDTLPCCFAGKGFSNPADDDVPDGWVLCADCGCAHRKELVKEVLF